MNTSSPAIIQMIVPYLDLRGSLNRLAMKSAARSREFWMAVHIFLGTRCSYLNPNGLPSAERLER